MNFTMCNELYTDFWELIGRYLSSDDVYSFALTCKGAWKACKRPTLMKRMSFPMLVPYRLTYEQRQTIQQMETNPKQRFKLIHGDVGAGKTLVSISYAIRNYLHNDAKIVMCGPPSLIKMWWTTLQKYFGVEPLVLHSTDPKYNSKTSWIDIKEKFILVSYKLLSWNPNLFSDRHDLLIFDEAHHRANVPFGNFKEVVGLSATTNKKSGLAGGIRQILSSFDLNIDNCTYVLNKKILSEALLPVQYHSYDLSISTELSMVCKNRIEYTRKGEQDFTSVNEICRYLSHPEIIDLANEFTGGYVTVGRKKFHVDDGNIAKRDAVINKWRTENSDYVGNITDAINKLATFDIMKFGKNYPKYVQVYHIVKWANSRGEKVVLFDNSVTYLPFLHKFLSEYGINSYIFTTHYDVTGRQRQLEKFKEDTKPGVLLSSIQMLGEGQNAPEGNHVIFFSHSLDHTKYYQGVGRCWRYPQKKTVHVHLIFASRFERIMYEHACGATDLRLYNWLDIL